MLVQALGAARSAGTPVVFANDNHDVWDGDGPGLVRRAPAGRGGDLVGPVALRLTPPGRGGAERGGRISSR